MLRPRDATAEAQAEFSEVVQTLGRLRDSKRGLPLKRFDQLAREIRVQLRVRDAILDGEVLAIDREGHPRFLFLMRGEGDLHYAAFDLLWLNGRDLRGKPLTAPTPPHPSYPSAHSCSSGAIAAVLARVFPDEARRRAAVAEESSLSRLYAGIHYRFDMDAGLALGRAVAAKALAADLDEMAVQ